MNTLLCRLDTRAMCKLMRNIVALVVMTGGLFACESMHNSKDFDRHALSQLSAPLDGGDFYWFDVKLTADMPGEDELAEAARLQWLGAWLQGRNLCVNGHEVVERRAFEFLEHNPARYDLRYKVACTSALMDAAG